MLFFFFSFPKIKRPLQILVVYKTATKAKAPSKTTTKNTSFFFFFWYQRFKNADLFSSFFFFYFSNIKRLLQLLVVLNDKNIVKLDPWLKFQLGLIFNKHYSKYTQFGVLPLNITFLCDEIKSRVPIKRRFVVSNDEKLRQSLSFWKIKT